MKKLYFGGPILTMDKESPRVSAVLSEDGTILAVGRYDDLFTPEAELVDLGGKTLMPGFVDGHSHMVGVGTNLMQNCDLMGCTGFDDLLDRIRRFREEKKLFNGQPIRARGYDLAIMKEGKNPTAALLDSLGFDNPIGCIHLSGHTGAYSTAAMRAVGIDDATYVCPEGGYAERDENGKLTGYFEETAKNIFGDLFNGNLIVEETEKVALAAQDYYIKHGFTTVQDGGGNLAKKVTVMENLTEKGELKVDVVVYLSSKVEKRDFVAETYKKHGGKYSGHFKVGGVKLVLDGSPQARTAWMSKPYEGESEYCAYPIMSDEELEARLRSAAELGVQPLAHCNGDAASEQFLRVWEKVSAEVEGAKALRPMMVHCQTVTAPQIERMAKCGMLASVFVGHCFYWGDTHLKNFGPVRGNNISPLKTMLDCGVVPNLHQDSPVTEPNMLHSVWCAVNRLTRSGVTVGEHQKIDVYDALIAATRGGAYVYFEEDTKGILKSGAQADFVVLSEDPTAVDPMAIKDIKVLKTIKNDAVLYCAE